jgi:hypothetical protein
VLHQPATFNHLLRPSDGRRKELFHGEGNQTAAQAS